MIFENDTLLNDDFFLLLIDAESDRTSILVTSADRNDIIPIIVQEENSIDTPPTIEELVAHKTHVDYCETVSLNVSHDK